MMHLSNIGRFPRALTPDELADLPPDVYHICVEKGTEPPYTGELLECSVDERYACICCYSLLFDPADYFDSGCGWPSFSACLAGAVSETIDRSHGMVRTEIVCSGCGAHLGHVFPDGPPPYGLRYCLNAAALTKAPAR